MKCYIANELKLVGKSTKPYFKCRLNGENSVIFNFYVWYYEYFYSDNKIYYSKDSLMYVLCAGKCHWVM